MEWGKGKGGRRKKKIKGDEHYMYEGISPTHIQHIVECRVHSGICLSRICGSQRQGRNCCTLFPQGRLE